MQAGTSNTKLQAPFEDVTLKLKWLHQFQFAGYYAAQLKGFYQDEGLNVKIEQRDVHRNPIQQVIDGEAEYGISDGVLMLYQARNEPLVIVSPVFQHSPQALFTLKSSGIDSPYQLNDKKIAFYLNDMDGLSLLMMFKALGIQPNFDRMINKNIPKTLIRDEISAYPGYLSNELYALKKAGHEINVFRPLNFGIDFYGDMIFTHKNEAKNHPERVERFKRASLKGWEYALANKKELAQYIKKNLGSKKTLEHLLFEADVIEQMISAQSVPIGSLDIGRLQFMQNLFKEHDLIETAFNPQAEIFSPQKKTISFSKKERAWMKQNPTVRVAVDKNWAPIEFVNKKGDFSGISANYLHYLSTKTGIDFLPVQTLEWSQALEQVKAKQLDMYSAAIHTTELKQHTHFTQNYLEFPMVFATQHGEPFIDDITRLSHKVVAVVSGYASQKHMQTKFPNIKLMEVNSAKEALEAVAKGKAYAYIDNIAVISYLIQNYNLSNLQITGEAPFQETISMAIRNDWPELHSIILKTMNNINEDTKTQLTEPWLKVIYKKEFEWTTLLKISLPLALLIVIAFFYNRRLKFINGQLLNVTRKLNQSNQKLERLAITDHLTKAYNRNHVDEVMKNEIHRSQRYHAPLSLLLFDMDDFKKINDTFGHIIGDEVLIKSAHWIQNAIRESDTFGRWGGEEFVVICPNTNLQQAKTIAEKIRVGIASLIFTKDFTQTISIGVARHHKNECIEQWLSRADSALYQAKRQGKNQVVCNQTHFQIKEDQYLA